MTLRTVPLLVVGAFTLSCALLAELRRPPRAPPAEAEKVVFSMYTPGSTVRLDGVRLRAVSMAMRDFLAGAAGTCFDQEDSYDVTVWMADPPPLDGGCPGTGETDAGEAPAGLASGVTCETLFGTPGLVYVAIDFRPGACGDDGGEVVLDEGAVYAIDVRQWRIAAARR